MLHLVSISPRPDRRTEDECTKEVAAAASGRMCVPAVLHRHFAHLARVRVRRDGWLSMELPEGIFGCLVSAVLINLSAQIKLIRRNNDKA